MIKVLVVEDSTVISTLLSAIINNEEDLEVIGLAKTGEEAILMVETLNPDLITMDIRMPVMDGIQAIQEIMSRRPKPIIVISSNIDDELQISFRAIDVGALAVLEKPCGIKDTNFSIIQKEIVSTIRCMAEVKLVRRRMQTKSKYFPVKNRSCLHGGIIAIGSSTGGPQVLKQILSNLPSDFAFPIVVTQHISKGFINGLVEWLDASSDLAVKVAQQGEKLTPGTVYFAPDHFHCQVKKQGVSFYIELKTDVEVNGFIPSVTRLFQSVVKANPSCAIGVILSGMGSDGADGLLAMRQEHYFTIAQNEESCIVFGMPKAAIDLNAVEQVMPVEEISVRLLAM